MKNVKYMLHINLDPAGLGEGPVNSTAAYHLSRINSIAEIGREEKQRDGDAFAEGAPVSTWRLCTRWSFVEKVAWFRKFDRGHSIQIQGKTASAHRRDVSCPKHLPDHMVRATLYLRVRNFVGFVPIRPTFHYTKTLGECR